jgi:hypothetical protein
MIRYVYPPDWTEEEGPAPKITLSEEEAKLLKDRLRNKLIQISRPILMKDAVEFIQTTWLHPRNIFIPDHKVAHVIADLRIEIGYPGQNRIAITAFTDLGDGKISVAAQGHEYSNGAHVRIVLTDNYDGVYQISDVNDVSFVIEAEWVESETSGFVVH